MSSPNYHRIQRQVVELGLAASLPAAEVQERLAREMHDGVTPRIAAIFDAVAGPHELLRLDRLEIDVGTIGGGDWTAQFRERVAQRLEQALARYRPEMISMTEGTPARPGAHSSPEMLSRLLLFFLEHGRLPWWGTRPEHGFGAAFEASRSEPDWSAVRALAQSDEAARSRLVDVLGDAMLDSAVTHWVGLPHAALACAMLAPPDGKSTVTRAWRRHFWLLLLDWIFHGGLEHRLVRALRAKCAAFGALHAVAGEARSNVATASATAAESSECGRLPSPWREWLVMPEGEIDVRDQERGAERPAVQERSAPKPPISFDAGANPADAEAIYLPCAGVLLVYPFLESLFRERGLLEGRAFRDAEARARAVYLVGALGYGRAEMPEYDLVIAKLLCGHPLVEPLAPVILDDMDLAACTELLMAVLAHWRALRSSSVEWLREQFFLRDGKLEEVDSGFCLTVERRAQDVLLARLPWGFGVIRLPWIQHTIFVQWID